MEWPNYLDTEDMILFLKECQLASYRPVLIDLDGNGKMREIEYPVNVEHIERSSLGSIRIWEGDDLVCRYWYDFEKELWTWDRRPWA